MNINESTAKVFQRCISEANDSDCLSVQEFNAQWNVIRQNGEKNRGGTGIILVQRTEAWKVRQGKEVYKEEWLNV